VNGRAAVIDVGSNSIKALVAGCAEDPDALLRIHEETLEVRISDGIGAATPALQPGRIEAAAQAVRQLLENCRTHGPLTAVRIVATSAVRSASNGTDFLDAVEAATGLRPVILSGDEEALAIARGARTDPVITRSLKDFTVFDLGGGSMELIRFEQDAVASHTSLPLGSVRLTEMLVQKAAEPLEAETAHAISTHVRAALAGSHFPLLAPLAGCGGGLNSLRVLFAREDGLDISASSPLLPANRIQATALRLCSMSLEQRIAAGVPPGRADIFPAAMITFSTLMECAGADGILHSFRNLRYGIAAALL
jgi:exopolyphosphatase/guanosine-5'-triphosphate,3'-diphosphate pyrophosphatase